MSENPTLALEQGALPYLSLSLSDPASQLFANFEIPSHSSLAAALCVSGEFSARLLVFIGAIERVRDGVRLLLTRDCSAKMSFNLLKKQSK